MYRAIDDTAAWRDAALELIERRQDATAAASLKSACLDRAAQFSWKAHAASMAAIYDDVWTNSQEAASLSRAASGNGIIRATEQGNTSHSSRVQKLKADPSASSNVKSCT
jgi:hypothetical protein